MFMRYLGGGVGHSPLADSDARAGSSDYEMDDSDDPMGIRDDGEALAERELEVVEGSEERGLEDGCADVEPEDDSDQEDSDEESDFDEEEWEWDEEDDDGGDDGEVDDGFDSL
jgi:hypothetical protein